MLSLEGRITLRVALAESVILIAMQMQLRLSGSIVKTNNYVLSMQMLGYMGTHVVVLQNTQSFSMSAYQEVTTLFCNVLFKGDVLFNYSIQNCFVNKHCTKTVKNVKFCLKDFLGIGSRSIQIPVKYVRWSFWQKQLTTFTDRILKAVKFTIY